MALAVDVIDRCGLVTKCVASLYNGKRHFICPSLPTKQSAVEDGKTCCQLKPKKIKVRLYHSVFDKPYDRPNGTGRCSAMIRFGPQ